MPPHIFALRLLGEDKDKTEIRFGLRDELEHERWVVSQPIDDVELLISVLLSETHEYQFERTMDPFVFIVDGSRVRPVAGLVLEINHQINHLRQGVQQHFFSQCYLGALDADLISQHISNLETLTEHYADLLYAFEQDTDNTIGRLYKRYINLEPDDDLIRTYHFLGGKRKLIVPKRGNYNRITFPNDLNCTNSDCRIGRICGSVRDLNDIAARIDWECLQIAHKMKDHQETDIPNGPYWVINPE